MRQPKAPAAGRLHGTLAAMRTRPLPALLLALGLLAALLLGCGGEEKPPVWPAMLERARLAADGLASEAYEVRAEITSALAAGKGADAPLRAISGRELQATISGALAAEGVELETELRFGAEALKLAYRSSAAGSWLGYGDRWASLAQPARGKGRGAEGGAGGSAPEPLAATDLLARLAALSDEAVLAGGEGEAREGLWFYPLALDATEAAARIAAAHRRTDEDAVKALLGDTDFEIAFDPQTDLPRRLEAELILSRRQLTVLLGDRNAARGVERLVISAAVSVAPKTGAFIVSAPTGAELVPRRRLASDVGQALLRVLGALGAKREQAGRLE